MRLKQEPPSGYDPPKQRSAPLSLSQRLEPVTALPGSQRGVLFETEESQGGFPWKLAVAALVIVALGTVGARYYLSSQSAAKPPAAETAASAAPTAPAEPVPPPPAKDSGQIVVQTQPPGIKVLLDGKAAGESPVTLNVVPGRHVVTFISSSGSTKQVVRVAAGKSVTVDVPVFSGWLAVSPPSS